MTHATIYKGKNTSFVQLKQSPKTTSGKHYFGSAIAKQTVFFKNPPKISAGAAIVTEREAQGPIGAYFKTVVEPKSSEKSFENEEIQMLKAAILEAVHNAGLRMTDINLLLAGDLLNQITTSSYVARDLKLPYIGLYSACSTMSQALAVGSCFLNAGYFQNIACATASHFATAERQYRYPLEYGAQRPPYAQWTVTGAGCSVLSAKGNGPRITSATFGKIVDFGINDVANMGAAMAPAALDTLLALFHDTGFNQDDFDLIVTGDLGKLGSDILRDLMHEQGYPLGQQYTDCGCLIYDVEQKIYQGGSGCGCSASVFNAYILKKIEEGCYNRVAFLATGALMSQQSCYQGETIPCISHGVVIEK